MQRQTLTELRAVVLQRYQLGELKSDDPEFGRLVLAPLQRVASADKVGLLLLGPTGSGKTHLAQCYHYACPRRDKDFVTIDCSQVTSAETLAAELFGYAPNSGYANAPPRGRHGKAQLADGGTLFIDEIGSMPLDLQQRLLRVIQQGTFTPLGASQERTVDVQIIAATHEDLGVLVRERRFREDLYWRLCEIVIRLPALDQRPADLPALARIFLAEAKARFKRPLPRDFTDAALRQLMRHPWSQHGNIRGLQHTINRAVLLADEDQAMLDVGDLNLAAPFPYAGTATAPSMAVSATPSVVDPAQPMDEEALRDALRRSIARYRGNARAMSGDPELARALGYPPGELPLSTLNYRIRELGLRTELTQARTRHTSGRYQEIVDAILEHRSGVAAAKALGITRDALTWQLRKAGTSVRKILADEGL